MKKLIKENWFRVGIIFLVFLVAFSVVYYFVFFLPKIKNQEVLSKNQLICSQLEEKVKNNYDKDYEHLGITYLSSSNHYNKKLQKCIVDISYDWNSSEPAYTEEYVVDVVENQRLMQCSERVFKDVETDICNKNGEKITLPQFNAFEKQYMSE